MRSNALLLCTGAIVFASGWFAHDVVRTDSVRLDEPTSNMVSAKRLDALSAQLDRIESLFGHAPQPAATLPATRESAETPRDIGALFDRIEQLESKFADVLEQATRAAASLEELSLRQPSPNIVGISHLFDAVAKDKSLMLRATVGMTYRDATLAFGTPTVKRDPEGLRRQSSGLPVSEWLWEDPESGRVLLIQFAGGTAVWAVFTNHESLNQK